MASKRQRRVEWHQLPAWAHEYVSGVSGAPRVPAQLMHALVLPAATCCCPDRTRMPSGALCRRAADNCARAVGLVGRSLGVWSSGGAGRSIHGPVAAACLRRRDGHGSARGEAAERCALTGSARTCAWPVVAPRCAGCSRCSAVVWSARSVGPSGGAVLVAMRRGHGDWERCSWPSAFARSPEAPPPAIRPFPDCMHVPHAPKTSCVRLSQQS
jgi:hypothetical protein